MPIEHLGAGAGGDAVVDRIAADVVAGQFAQLLPIPYRAVAEQHLLHAVLVGVVAGLAGQQLVRQVQGLARGETQGDAVAIAADRDAGRGDAGRQLEPVEVADRRGVHVVGQRDIAAAIEAVGIAATLTSKRDGEGVGQSVGNQQVIARATKGIAAVAGARAEVQGVIAIAPQQLVIAAAAVEVVVAVLAKEDVVTVLAEHRVVP
ncbi:hypothetical protein D3C75_746620 [compost metagenome]